MHPRIREFPSLHFYDGKLNDAPTITVATYSKEYHRFQAFRPFIFYDLEWSSEQRGHSSSTMNPSEAKFCTDLVADLCKKFPSIPDNAIGIVTPYQQQASEIRKLCPRTKIIEVSTVDGFQGREKDVVVFSCVRAPVCECQKNGFPPSPPFSIFSERIFNMLPHPAAKSIGFLADVRRMNVGLTRAKYEIGRAHV